MSIFFVVNALFIGIIFLPPLSSMETKPFTTGDTISIDLLRKLLIQIKELMPEVHVRFRLMGQMWQKNFCRVFVVTETGIVLIDTVENKVEIIPNINQIIQFELDSRIQQYSPYNHYTIETP